MVETVASELGIGAILMQQGRPVAFMSKTLGSTKRAWSVYNKEMLAILEAVKLWRPYLLGRWFRIQTDQRSLKFMLEQRVITPEQQKWVAKLLGYDYEIAYKPGRDNFAADALSRRVDVPTLLALSQPQSDIWDKIRGEVRDNEYFVQLREKFQNKLEEMKN